MVSLTTVSLGTTYTYSVVVADDALPTNNEATETITFTVSEANVAPVLDDTYVSNFTAISEHIVDGDNVGQGGEHIVDGWLNQCDYRHQYNAFRRHSHLRYHCNRLK